MYKMALYDVFRKARVQLYIKKMPKTQYRVEQLFGLSCTICTNKYINRYKKYTK